MTLDVAGPRVVSPLVTPVSGNISAITRPAIRSSSITHSVPSPLFQAQRIVGIDDQLAMHVRSDHVDSFANAQIVDGEKNDLAELGGLGGCSGSDIRADGPDERRQFFGFLELNRTSCPAALQSLA